MAGSIPRSGFRSLRRWLREPPGWERSLKRSAELIQRTIYDAAQGAVAPCHAIPLGKLTQTPHPSNTKVALNCFAFTLKPLISQKPLSRAPDTPLRETSQIHGFINVKLNPLDPDNPESQFPFSSRGSMFSETSSSETQRNRPRLPHEKRVRSGIVLAGTYYNIITLGQRDELTDITWRQKRKICVDYHNWTIFLARHVLNTRLQGTVESPPFCFPQHSRSISARDWGDFGIGTNNGDIANCSRFLESAEHVCEHRES